MTDPLEAALRLCITREGVDHLTLASLSNGSWQASLQRERGGGYRVEFSTDPINALLLVLNPKIPDQPEPANVTKPDSKPSNDLSDFI